jgi:hypothetical protein
VRDCNGWVHVDSWHYPSKFVEGALAFDAVEFLGFPVDAFFDPFQTVGGGLKQMPLRAGLRPANRYGRTTTDALSTPDCWRQNSGLTTLNVTNPMNPILETSQSRSFYQTMRRRLD